MQKVNVTIITGFLGAGKTTLVNVILKNNPEKQFALVENEFGEVSIDTKLIKGMDASQMFELNKGCICCTITDEYELVLQELVSRFPGITNLLIETSGVADPGTVIRPFFRDEELKKRYQFKGTICLIDALNFENCREKELLSHQVAVSDLVLVSKSELVKKESELSLIKKIRQINPFAPVEICKFGNMPEHKTNLPDMELILKPNFLNSRSKRHGIQTKTIRFNHLIDKKDFVTQFSYFSDINKGRILRMKGIIGFVNETYEYVLQGVGGSFTVEELDIIRTSEDSFLVLIKYLNEIKTNFSF